MIADQAEFIADRKPAGFVCLVSIDSHLQHSDLRRVHGLHSESVGALDGVVTDGVDGELLVREVRDRVGHCLRLDDVAVEGEEDIVVGVDVGHQGIGDHLQVDVHDHRGLVGRGLHCEGVGVARASLDEVDRGGEGLGDGSD